MTERAAGSEYDEPVTIHRAQSGFVLETRSFIGAPRAAVFDFFSKAENLETLTPPLLNFEIVTPTPVPMMVGALIDYRLRVRGFPVKWRTRIAAWETQRRFVDEQLRGPYSRWVHEHVFETVGGGTLMSDRVEYRVPGGVLTHLLFVRRDLMRIFEYRRSRLSELFPNPDRPEPRARGSSERSAAVATAP